MLTEKEKINALEFEKEFAKRFTNFCNKSPVELSFKTTMTAVYVHEHKSNEVKEFPFDFSQNVKSNIKTIKDWLVENKYPVMVEIKEETRDLTTDEIKKLIEEEGVSEDEALMAKHSDISYMRWRIERVIVRRDEFFLRNLEENLVYHYKMNMPCILFLKKFREKLDPFEAYELFSNRSTLIQKIEEKGE